MASPKYANTTISSASISSGSGITYTQGTTNWNSTNTYAAAGKMKLVGEDADIEINGKSLTDTLTALEKRLNILVPNPELEAEWEELRQLGDKYRKLEADLKEKARIWGALKNKER